MKENLSTNALVSIDASVEKVWAMIIDPGTIEKYMMGLRPISDWKVGGELRWIGRHSGKEDDAAKGIIQALEVNKKFQFTFYFAGYGYPDEQQYYNTVVFELNSSGDSTILSVQQGDFAVFKEGSKFRDHSQTFWDSSLKILKELAEKKDPL